MSYNTSIYPYDTVVRITDTIGGVSYQGSGVLISPDEVLTASHVLFSAGVGSATNITVTPGYDFGDSPYGPAIGTSFHYYPVNDAGDRLTLDQSQWDYAVIHLAKPFLDAGYMGIAPDFEGGDVNVTGYPASAHGVQVSSQQFDYPNPYFNVLDGTALGKGSSGGPVWIDGSEGPMVVGVVSTLSGILGHSALITTSAFNQINAWVAQDDGGASPVVPPTSTASHRIVSFQGFKSQYTITYTGNGNATVTDSVPSRDVIVSTLGAEALQFADQPYFIENGDGANIARLYSAGLGRIPDTGGLFGWENIFNNNVSAAAKSQGVFVSLAQTSGGYAGALSIADGIIGSAEFAAKYGALSDPAFITQLYQNVLGRGPDAAGLNGWLADMAPEHPGGTFTRGMVLVGFAESPENIVKASAWMIDMARSG